MKRNFDLHRDAAERGVLLVAHRGVWGGNVPPNTLAAYDTALAHGADMLEIDVDMTADGRLVIFHPGMERAMLGWHGRIGDEPWSFVRKLRYMNIDECPTQFGLCTLDEVLARYKGRCYLNVDKFWDHPAEIAAAIRKRGMADQCLVKTGANPRVLDILEEHAADMPFLAVVRTQEELAAVRKRKLRHVGAEVLFASEDHPFASDAFKSWSAGQSRLHLPKDSAEWRAWADANATAWWDLDDDTRDSYFDRWPREKKPYARTKANTVPANQWVIGWTPPGRGTVIILR